jgi:hypothetical protein
MNKAPAMPSLSVVVVTPTNIADLRLPLRGLLEQRIRHALELVLVTPADESADDHRDRLAGFHSVAVVHVPQVRSRGAAAAVGVRHARAPIVAIMENHVVPKPDWAEEMLRAHQGPWMAVGPAVDWLNLRSVTSRAYRLLFYARLSEREEPQETDHLPWHNVAYKAALLQPFMSDLETWLDREDEFHGLLRTQGRQCYLWPAARLSHVMVSRTSRVFQLAFHTGRAFAGQRYGTWPWRRRLLYAAASPLFPWIRLRQLLPDLQRIARREPTWLLLPFVVLLLHGIALGELVGYLRGGGAAARWLDRHELCWEERLSRSDLRDLDTLLLGAGSRAA